MENQPEHKKIVLIDDQNSFRELLRLFFDHYSPDHTVIGEASTALDALSLLEKSQPDLVVTDVFLKDMPIVSFVQTLRTRFPSLKIVAFCRWLDPVIARRLLHAGVHGLASKEDSLQDLHSALTVVLNGGCFVPEAVGPSLYEHLMDQSHLTERETEVLRLIAEGYATKEVGDKLSISVKTTEKYREKIMAKLHIHDAVRLTRYAIKNGLAAL